MRILIQCKVVKKFRDKLTDVIYPVGSVYETEDKDRVKELQIIGYVDTVGGNLQDMKHVGGGYYELPNGEKVRGKEKALAILKDMDEYE